MGEVGEVADEAGRNAEQSDWLDAVVRFGLVDYGLVYVLMAVLAAQLAFGEYGGSVSEGALTKLAQQPFGKWGLVVLALGMFCLVAWRLIDAAVGHRELDGLELARARVYDGVKVPVYGWIGYKAVMTALGDSGGGGSVATTAKLMELPGGQVLVALVGLGIAGYGVAQAWRGLGEKHREHLAAEGRSGEAGSAYLLLGKVGYVAKGVAFTIVGGLFVYAAVTHQPRASGGLDRALREILQQPFGSWLAMAMAVGLGCYGLFQVVRARHLSR